MPYVSLADNKSSDGAISQYMIGRGRHVIYRGEHCKVIGFFEDRLRLASTTPAPCGTRKYIANPRDVLVYQEN